MSKDFKIVYDELNRMFTIPHNENNLFKAAETLKIKKCWFEKDHFILPDFKAKEIIEEFNLMKVGKNTLKNLVK